MAISTYLARALLRAVLRNTAYTPPTTVYLSLHSGDPGSTGANELGATGNYGRTGIGTTAGWVDPTLAVPSVSENVSDVLFPTATAAWNSGTAIGYVGLWDALTSGNFLAGGAISPATTVAAGDTARFAVGDLDATLGA